MTASKSSSKYRAALSDGAWRLKLEPPPQPGSIEASWIRALIGNATSAQTAIVGPGDDAAVLQDGLVVSVDTLVQGVHFDERLSASDIGFKAVAVSVSDMAAMGARPLWMVLSLSAANGWPHIEDFAAGVRQARERWSVELIGGDTTGSPGPLVVSVTMAGRAARPVLRSGAHADDQLWVTGTLGLAGAGYLLTDPPVAALEALRRPSPPLDFANALAESGVASAMMDLSDGLAADLPRLAAASGLGAQVRGADLPHSDCLSRKQLEHFALVGGDDYQLLFAARPAAHNDVLRLGREHGVAVTHIGELSRGSGCTLDGADWPKPAFEHFDPGGVE